MRTTRRKTHYEILGVKQTASPEDVKRAFRRRAMRHHPDRNPNDPKAHAKFNRISEAYEVLSDPGRRQTYDLALTLEGAPAPPQPPPPPREAPRPAAGSYGQWVEERERRARQAQEAARQRMRENTRSEPAPKARGRSGLSAAWGLVVLVVFIVRIVANCA